MNSTTAQGQSALAPAIGQSPKAELVFGFVYPLGTEVDPVIDYLQVGLKEFGYKPNAVVRISDYLKNLKVELVDQFKTDAERLIKLGNKACREARRKDFLALAAISQIAQTRAPHQNRQPVPSFDVAHIVRSFKRPEEVETFRRVYRPGFYLIGVFSTDSERKEYLRDRKGYKDETRRLMEMDQNEEDDEYGQRTRKTFHLADIFVKTQDKSYVKQINRFLDLVFGHPFVTPTKDEHGMFLAAAASMRSAQFGRQVGASILNATGDVLSVGTNEVPKTGGGSYWEDDKPDVRDHKRNPDSNGSILDSNDQVRREIQEDIIKQLDSFLDKSKDAANLWDLLGTTKLDDITEYGRAVHAEMDALLSCVRCGVSPKNAVLYTTTFPCHNCARHIIAAGIRRVIYVEPYPKSRAWDLHDDAITFDDPENIGKPGNDERNDPSKKDDRVPFLPFVGIAPRRFLDLFSMELSSGSSKQRKDKEKGLMVRWSRQNAKNPRVPMLATSYLEREMMAVEGINETMKKLEGQDHGHEKKS